MAKIRIKGDTSGYVDLQAPAVAGAGTISLPNHNGTLLTSASDSSDFPSAILTSTSNLATVAGVPTGNTPYFFAYKTSGGTAAQTLSNASTDLITLDGSVVSDSGSWASNRFTVPTGKGGTYYIMGQISIYNGSNAVYGFVPKIYKNGGEIAGNYAVVIYPTNDASIRHITGHVQVVTSLSATDYIQLYVYSSVHTGTSYASQGDGQGSFMTNIVGWRMSE